MPAWFVPAGALAGAAGMYFLDPVAGAGRRHRAWDACAAGLRAWSRQLGAKLRYARGAGRGWAARAGRTWTGWTDRGPSNTDDTLVAARVRSRLGRLVGHPGAVRVQVEGGRVTLEGPVLASERRGLVRAVQRVPGVTEVCDRLSPHASPLGVPGLQGGKPGSGPARPGFSPFLPLGLGAAAIGAREWRRGRAGLAWAGLIAAAGCWAGPGWARSAWGRYRARRPAGGRRWFTVATSVVVEAPAERAFAFWTAAENFPLFMTDVLEVRPLGGDRSHWTVAGPAGLKVEWVSEVTRMVPGVALEWRSLPGSAFENSGQVRFEALPGGDTRVDFRMAYRPPKGWLGLGLAKLLRSDPGRRLGRDLARMKCLLETGVVALD